MTILHQSGPFYRTKLLSIERAARFAKALQANARFTDVTIETSTQARGEARYYVRYRPMNAAGLSRVLDAAQADRARRAATESFTFCQDADHDFAHCLSHGSGEVYETTLHSCSCDDARYRAEPNGLACKHRIALGDAIRRGEVTRFETPCERRVRVAAQAAEFDRIFG